MNNAAVTCPRCGYAFHPDPADASPVCPLCAGRWEGWQLVFPSTPTDADEDDDMAWGEWLGQIPQPAYFEIDYTEDGLRVHLFTPPGVVDERMAEAWSSLTRRRMRLRRADEVSPPLPQGWALLAKDNLPSFALHTVDALPTLIPHLNGQRLRIWLLGHEEKLQSHLRKMLSYQYGVESGVSDRTPNPWGWRLGLARAVMLFGGGVAALGGGLAALHLFKVAVPMLAGGGVVFVLGILGILDFLRWRSIPKDVVEQATTGPLLSAAFSLHATEPQIPAPALRIFSGDTRWLPFDRVSPWPDIKRLQRPVAAQNIAALLRPPARAESAASYAADGFQEVPAPPPTRALTQAPLLLGKAVATGEPVGIDPDAHALVVGGSRSGKSSAVYQLLEKLAHQDDEAPGLFLVDPHLSLADAFLDAVAQLPEPARSKAVRRLRVIDVTRPEVTPLNLLTLPDYSWAGGALVELGQRIWEDYWGPRMQAALLGLFRLGHVWNQHRPDAKMGLIHTVFMAYNRDFREVAMQYLRPDERINILALNALLGQADGGGNRSWLTEVISPVISKLMALEMSPWLFDAMHRDRFVDMAQWVDEKAWIVLRLSTGDMGRPAARLAAATIYNVFEAVYRKTVTADDPKPFYVVVDEAQEIAAGMKLENPLAEGGKFGMRVFVLTQSLAMLKQVPGFENVVQSLLANTSTQMFFSPDPDDAELMERILRTYIRYGDITFDLPSLQCWLRARLAGRWQPPTLVRVEPIPRANQQRVQALIDEVIETHPDDYAPPQERGQNAVDALMRLLPPGQQAALGFALAEDGATAAELIEKAGDENDRLGL